MKTSPYFIDDLPLQILFLDNDPENGRAFFNSGLDGTWFDYDLHMISQPDVAAGFLEPKKQVSRPLDLCFIANGAWFEQGEDLVRQIRSDKTLANLPVYCVVSCSKKLTAEHSDCMNPDWRKETQCNEYARLAATPFLHYMATDHPARLDGIVCGNNITTEIAQIINNMAAFWFESR